LRIPRMLSTTRYLAEDEKETPKDKRPGIICREIAQIFMADRAQIWLSQEDGSPHVAAEWYSAGAYVRHRERNIKNAGFELCDEDKAASLRPDGEKEQMHPLGKVHEVFYEEEPQTVHDTQGDSQRNSPHNFRYKWDDPDIRCEVVVPIGPPGLSCGVVNL